MSSLPPTSEVKAIRRPSGDQLGRSVYGPPKLVCVWAAETGQLHWVLALGVAYPDFGAPRTIRHESDPATVGRNLRVSLQPRRRDETHGRARAAPPARLTRQLEAIDIYVHRPLCISQTVSLTSDG